MMARKRRKLRSCRQDAERAMAAEYIQPAPVEDPRNVVQFARMRLHGLSKEAAMSIMASEQAGLAIHLGARDEDERGKLWAIFTRYDGADETYFRRIIGRPRFANVTKMEYLPETFETRPDDRPDARSDDEKDRDAVNGWMRWQGKLGCLDRSESWIITKAARQTCPALVTGGRLTTTGAAFVAAMRMLRDVDER